MAAGRAFVSTPAGGVVDLAVGPVLRARNGAEWHRNAVLCVSDPEVFADVLSELVVRRDLVARMGSDARSFALDRHCQPAMLAALDSLFLELLQSNPARTRPAREMGAVS
jgi:hypothetical protein